MHIHPSHCTCVPTRSLPLRGMNFPSSYPRPVSILCLDPNLSHLPKTFVPTNISSCITCSLSLSPHPLAYSASTQICYKSSHLAKRCFLGHPPPSRTQFLLLFLAPLSERAHALRGRFLYILPSTRPFSSFLPSCPFSVSSAGSFSSLTPDSSFYL